jgi:hypothetical protein
MAEIELVFAAYAAAQTARARALLAAHRRDRDGACRSCGQAHPCDLRRYAGELRVYFDQWLPPGAEPAVNRPAADEPATDQLAAGEPAAVDNPTEAGQDSIHGTR